MKRLMHRTPAYTLAISGLVYSMMEEAARFRTARKGLRIISKVSFPVMLLFSAVVIVIDAVHCYAFHKLGITAATPSYFWLLKFCDLVAITGSVVLMFCFVHDLSSDASPLGFRQVLRLELCGISSAIQWIISFARFPSDMITVVSGPIPISLATESAPNFTKLVFALFFFCTTAILRYTAVLQEDSALIL